MSIRSFLFADIFRNNVPMLFEPDDGAGGGAGGSGSGSAVLEGVEEEEEVEEKKFSQKDLDKYLQDRVKNIKKELKSKTTEYEDLQKKVAALEAKVAEGQTPSDNHDKTLDGKLEAQQRKYEGQLEEIKRKLDEAEKGRLAAEQKQRLVERDTELQQALVASGCVDLVGGQRYFVPQIEWDEDDQKWMFRTKSGHLLSVAEGVEQELPKYMRNSSMATGGSGTGSSKDKKRTETQNKLKEEEAKLEQLAKEMRRNQNADQFAAAVLKQRAVVQKLKQELAVK